MEKSRISVKKIQRNSPSAVSRFIEDVHQDRVLIKDHNYFKDKTWNNSYLASGKIYNFYHKKENQLLEKQKQIKEETRTETFEAKNAYFEQNAIKNRESALKSFNNLTCQRTHLQKNSSQPILDKHLKGIQCLLDPEKKGVSDLVNENQLGTQKTWQKPAIEFNSSKINESAKMLGLVNRKPSLLWNKLSRLNSKQLDLLITPQIIEMDKQAFINIKKKGEKENEDKNLIVFGKRIMRDWIKKKNKTDQSDFEIKNQLSTENHMHKFMNYDDQAFNGLYMNDVLRIKGIAESKITRKLMKSNSLLRTLKFETMKIDEFPKRSLKAKKQSLGEFETRKNLTEVFELEKCKEDLNTFDINLEKVNKFKEGRYPKINLDHVGRFLQRI